DSSARYRPASGGRMRGRRSRRGADPARVSRKAIIFQPSQLTSFPPAFRSRASRRIPGSRIVRRPKDGAPMTPRLRDVFFVVLGLAAPAAARGDTPPWEAQPFAADGKDVIKAAAAAAAADKSDVVVLFEESRFRFEPDGRCDYRYHIVYRIQTEAGVRGWSSIGSGWAPWFEQKP